MTDDEFRAQMALSDARLDIANGKQISPERYREVLAGLIAGRESKARALAEAASAKGRAKTALRPKAIPLDPALFFGTESEKEE